MENKSETKEDFIYLLILLIIASISGIYLLLTTNIIAKDGVFYINQARAFPEEPLKIIRSVTPPGYPILIWLVHSLTALISPNVSTTGWIYSARFISLFSRVLTVVPLYFIGKKLLGQINSFWGILLLLLLPYPTRFGSDALRDWPYMLFLATVSCYYYML
jgi:4-amino-4-deoxy-L-arabinose transferase-like glycosyltransferase